MFPLLRTLGICALLLMVLPAHAAKDLLAQGTDDHEAQIIGWSADGKRFAVRLYVRDPLTSQRVDEEPTTCEGYLNHEGNPFRGGLFLLAYERSRLLSTFPIHDKERCTPPDEAKQRLENAKKRLGALGINLEAPGQELIPPPNDNRVTVSQGTQAPYTLEYEVRLPAQAPAPSSGKQRGTVEQTLYVHKGDTRQKVLSRKTPYEYSTAMAGYWRAGLDRVFLSPSGTTLVVLSHERVGNMSGGRKSLRLLGVLSWSGNTLKPL